MSGADSLHEALATTGDPKRIIFDPTLGGEAINLTPPHQSCTNHH